MADIEARDRELLNLLQSEVPLSSTPFALLGQMLDMSEKEVIKRTERLKREGAIRRISGQFDARALGYKTCLVAARVHADHIEQSAAAINLHPGVTQNYVRNHDFNLWFTIAIPPGSRLGLERTVAILADEASCSATLLLPTLKLLKSGGDVSDGSPNEVGADTGAGVGEFAPLTERELEQVRLLQRDLPALPRPFETLAGLAGESGEELLSGARALLKRQVMRKFAASVEARKPSFSATTMGVWKVPASRTDEFGSKMAEFKAVSHCYLRPVYPDWPYNVFTTVHGRSVDECEAVLAEISAGTGITERAALYPTRELKRARITFFSPEVEQWESSRLGAASESAVS